MIRVMGSLDRGWFHSRLVSGVGCGECSAVEPGAAQFQFSKQVHNSFSAWPSSRQQHIFKNVRF